MYFERRYLKTASKWEIIKARLFGEKRTHHTIDARIVEYRLNGISYITEILAP